MENGQIPNSAITASTIWSEYYAAYYGRLNSERGWFAGKQDAHQWLQIDFGEVTQVTAISTQGYYKLNRWVKSYTLSYSNTGLEPFTPYKQQHYTKVHVLLIVSGFHSCEVLDLTNGVRICPLSVLTVYYLVFSVFH